MMVYTLLFILTKSGIHLKMKGFLQKEKEYIRMNKDFGQKNGVL